VQCGGVQFLLLVIINQLARAFARAFSGFAGLGKEGPMKIHIKLSFATALFIALSETLIASSSFTGNISYTLSTVTNPSSDQSDAYGKIRAAMDSAIWYYNTYTTITNKLTVEYNTSVSTADGSSNGNIRFGKNRSYMTVCTSMHEIAHTTGIGTTTQWGTFISNGNYTGKNALDKLRKITGDPKAVLNGDSQHFWPYGLNYETEVKSTNDFIYHCLIVNAMQRDLFPNKYPTVIFTDASGSIKDNFSISLISDDNISYNLPAPGFVTLRVYSLSGQKVADVLQGNMGAGNHTIPLNFKSLSHGFYMYKFQTGQHKESRSFIIK
jgi:hypothetical protein